MGNISHATLATPCRCYDPLLGYTSHRVHRFRRRGATSVEFAIVAPLLLLVVFGMIELGRMVMVRQSLTNAARVGCREAALATTGSSQDAEDAVHDYLQSVMTIGTAAVAVNPSGLAGLASGTPITVEVEVNFSDVSWLPNSFLLTGLLRGTSTQRRE